MIFQGFTKSAGGSWMSHEIDRRTGGLGFCHTFTLFGELGLILEAHADFGVRFRARAIDAARELLFPFPDLTPEKEAAMLRAACLMAGDGYDFGAVAHIECPIFRQRDGEEMCSEASVIVGHAGLYYPGVVAYETAPNRLYVVGQQTGIVPAA